MFAFKFGVAWVSFISFFILIIILSSLESGFWIMTIAPIIILSLVNLIGVYLIVIGLKEIRTDQKTKQYGKYVYGRILDFVPTGSSINGIPELKAVISAYIPSTREVKEFRETIGFGNNSYNIGDYLVLKHYEDDVNIIQHAVESKIPIDVIEKLDSKISVSEDKSYVIINNKKYVKKQNENDSYQDNW